MMRRTAKVANVVPDPTNTKFVPYQPLYGVDFKSNGHTVSLWRRATAFRGVILFSVLSLFSPRISSAFFGISRKGGMGSAEHRSLGRLWMSSIGSLLGNNTSTI